MGVPRLEGVLHGYGYLTVRRGLLGVSAHRRRRVLLDVEAAGGKRTLLSLLLVLPALSGRSLNGGWELGVGVRPLEERLADHLPVPLATNLGASGSDGAGHTADNSSVAGTSSTRAPDEPSSQVPELDISVVRGRAKERERLVG